MKENDLFSLKFWYPINLLEGEGLGSSYEYVNKLQKLERWFGNKMVDNMIVAGLPGKYGFNLDLILYFYLKGAKKIVVVDDRLERLDQFGKILADKLLPKRLQLTVICRLVTSQQLTSPDFYKKQFGNVDLVVNSEVIQNWDPNRRKIWLNTICDMTTNLTVFVPNRGNLAHMRISKLKSLSVEELNGLFQRKVKTGYLDMPPFPPGIKRNKEQKASLVSFNLFWLFAPNLLMIWMKLQDSLLSRWLPTRAHLVYALYKK